MLYISSQVQEARKPRTPPARPPPPKFQKDEQEKEVVHPVPSPRRVGQALTHSCLENSVAYVVRHYIDFENNLGISQKFTNYLKEKFVLRCCQNFFFIYFSITILVKQILVFFSGRLWVRQA